MAQCERLSKCPFFHAELAHLPKAADQMKQSYCLGDKGSCARYLVAIKGIPVPADLFPNENDRALKIISEKSR
ncbi:MAG: hypothetical protein ABSG34_16585 [Candidatus Sulfotelmatobacter sp.]|jgi:hypothetical protein